MALDVTHDEAKRLVVNLGRTRGDAGFTEDEGCVVIDWARKVKLDTYLLELALSGEIGISVRDGDVVYHGVDVKKLVQDVNS